ncbi:MAG TPA: hypothetical protein PLA68_00850 [Panacibacter sp.]|nr:hypothetical protein [Panacibacter sp.]
MKQYIKDFIESLKEGKIHLYNEFGLQHELGYFLRQREIPLKFEWNVNLLDKNIQNPLKKEMDLFIDNGNKYVIEIKFPNKGAFPKRMTQSILDIFLFNN